MPQKKGITLAVIAFAIYVFGGISCFGGIALILLMKGRDLWGWGDGRSIGFLFLCIGAAFSILGVILMRIYRNRDFN